nr:EXLDI protein [uncultured Lachnoanaerobaculum sp.]
MEYTEIKLNVSNDNIKEYKLFEGIKIYSDIFISEDKKSLTNKRVYITKKKNYVYYERTDVNWNYWNDKNKYDFIFDTNSIKNNIIFEVSKDLTSFSHYLGEKVVEKIMLKEATGEIVEKLDI